VYVLDDESRPIVFGLIGLGLANGSRDEFVIVSIGCKRLENGLASKTIVRRLVLLVELKDGAAGTPLVEHRGSRTVIRIRASNQKEFFGVRNL
jgi:hypothetical protein